VRNDTVDVAAVRNMRPAAVVLSPGPCTPREAGVSLDLARELSSEIPLLGVCLGHQVIAESLGAKVVRAARPVHGQTSDVRHERAGLFAGLPVPLTVCRYHSLVVEPRSLPADLRPTAWTEDGVLMALEHASLPVYGVQFHPEAILTACGYDLLANFLRLAGLPVDVDASQLAADEVVEGDAIARPLPEHPMTF
jgi:anthranilate synthase component II